MLTNSENWDAMSSHRKRLETLINNFLAPISDKLICQLANLKSGMVLDIATGTGEPGITLAQLNPGIQVVGMDISAHMLAMARNNALSRSVSNYSVLQCDATAIPYENFSFDAIICRNGIMFFDNLSGSLKEMNRLLKPGGCLHLSTWGHLEKNSWINVMLRNISTLSGTRPYRSYTPGMFYCMLPGFITDWLEISGFKDITEEEVTGIVSFVSPDEYWDYVTHVSAVVVEALKQINQDEYDVLKEVVFEKIQAHVLDGRLFFQWTSNISRACKT